MSHKIRNFLGCTGLLLALALFTSQAMAALSISQTPLFLTISLPPNITVLLDDSGSLEWAHAPDSLGGNGNAVVNVSNGPANATSTLTATTTPNAVHHSGHWSYSCTLPYTESSPWIGTGSSSTPPPSDVCQLFTTTYTCNAGETVTGSGSSTTCTGYQDTPVYIPDTNEYKSSAFNPLAYNPQINYVAPYNASGAQLTTAFTAAYVNGFDTALGSINLSTNYEATVDYNPSTSNTTLSGSTSHCAQSCVRDEDNSCNGIFDGSGNCASIHNPGAAFYYTLTPTSATAVANNCGKHPIPGTSNPVQYVPQVNDDSCYTRITVSSTSSPNGTDERQNFANWYTFYRTRNLTVASGADVAFNGLSQTYRVAWLDLHTCPDFTGSNCKGWDSTQTSVDNRIGTFTGQHRADFFNWLSRFPANGGTTLRQQLDKVGNYYMTSGAASPYAFNPAIDGGVGTDSPEYVCRPNYAAVMTDGEWNEATSSLSVQPGNADSTAVTLPDNVPYTAIHPYSDGNTNTLSDIAFYYWSTNLRPDLGTSTALEYQQFSKTQSIKDDNGTVVSLSPYWNPENDPASWPHMVTFTIGLGLSSDLVSPPTWGGSTFVKGYNDLVTGLDAWPASFSCGDATGGCTDPLGNVYDLWHAAIDSRGEFFAADDPQAVVAAFNSIITRIQGRVGSSSSVAVNSTRLNSNTLVYQAQFNSSDWSGEVAAYSLNTTNGSVNTTTPVWKASAGIPVATSRNIFTATTPAAPTTGKTSTTGVAFQWSNLSADEQANLNNNIFGVADGNGSLRVPYLRGDQSNEQTNGGLFRTRNVLLGDVVDSNPFYVGAQDFGYSANTTALPEGASYEAFVTTKAANTPMLYFGANDGMLHAVNANTGAEVFTYIPHGVYPNLSALTDPTYVHQFYVDGSPNAVDAYFGSTPTWHTVLVGTTGAGARNVYALDVTNAATESGTNLIFDYDGAMAGDNSMGYTLGVATVARLHDGNWYVLWGNGYNSPNQTAVLYLYNLSTGAITTFDTKAGSSTSPNGMSTPAPIDFDGDKITDAIYAGDLLGNVWKLDVSSSNPSQWGWAFGTKTSPGALFTAHDANGNVQPITDRLQVGKNKNGQVVVYFGTGTYFLTSDNNVPSNPPVQSFYGIIDAGTQVAGAPVAGKSYTDRSELLQQFIVAQATPTSSSTVFRVTTAYSMTSSDQGWFMDLLSPPVPGTAVGERSVSDSVLDGGRIIFTTVIPQGNACQFGGTSWLMELDANSGAQLTVSPFDVNGDGNINNSDTLTVTYTDPATNKTVTVAAPVSGQQSTVGIIKTPAIIDAGNKQYKYFSGSTGKFQDVAESNPNSGGRLSWQQLQ
ncbi:MAG TPA: PilC/PilY family type IV pilus protein [Gammaproteobacteria bacterium]|nr:PilC/PilY family type IV pilus protein [Gammaproteobacteria bacterium]